MSTKRAYSRYTKEAGFLLGSLIKLHRKKRKWTQQELAERAGISVATIKKIEKGNLTCATGIVFEAAALVGIRLFESMDNLKTQKERIEDKIMLLPKSIRKPKKEVDNDF